MDRPDFQPEHLILGSASPRRSALLREMGLKFQVRTQASDESYPQELKAREIPEYLSVVKARALTPSLSEGEVLLTADTIVWQDASVLEKPATPREASEVLGRLSGRWHDVITSVCFTALGEKPRVVSERTEVKFADLDPGMIRRYLEVGHPLDKAGAYGIQEWIGLVGIEAIRGSYTNVVGLPTQLVYKTLRDIVKSGF